jgi:hypothetical protein
MVYALRYINRWLSHELSRWLVVTLGFDGVIETARQPT